jgi:hypothetical protein
MAVSVAALLALAAGLSVTSHVHRAASAGAAPASAAPAPAGLVRFLCSYPLPAPGLKKIPSRRPSAVLVLSGHGTHRLCVELRPHRS